MTSGKSTCCVFCGTSEPPQHKLLSRSYVVDLLERQRALQVSEPVLELMSAELSKRVLLQQAEGPPEDDAAEAHELSCMCCYYWVERRSALDVVPLPMQKLLWFVRTLSWCESVCDSRVLQRLVETVVEQGNVFARLFEDAELLALESIARENHSVRAAARNSVRVQGAPRFCIKRRIAQLWQSQNADCLLLPHAAAADWLR
jgi:hypothetical protein